MANDDNDRTLAEEYQGRVLSQIQGLYRLANEAGMTFEVIARVPRRELTIHIEIERGLNWEWTRTKSRDKK